MNAMKTRAEHDLLGSLDVPAEAKKACVIANQRTGRLDQRIADAIASASDKIAADLMLGPSSI